MEAVFPAKRSGFCIECYSLQRVETDFFAVFFYSEQILSKWKPLFKLMWSRFLWSNLSPTIGNHFLRVFYMICSCLWKQFFGLVKTSFLNESFIPTGGIRIFVQWKFFFYLQLFFLLAKTTSRNAQGEQKGPRTIFSSVTSTNVRISPHNFLTYSFDLFVTPGSIPYPVPVPNYWTWAKITPQKIVFSGQIFIQLRLWEFIS